MGELKKVFRPEMINRIDDLLRKRHPGESRDLAVGRFRLSPE